DGGDAEDDAEQGAEAVRDPLQELAPLGVRRRQSLMGVAHEVDSKVGRARFVANVRRKPAARQGQGGLFRASATARSTRPRASSRLVCNTAPEASRWPPPPKYSATFATSTRPRERKLTFTPPRGCSM